MRAIQFGEGVVLELQFFQQRHFFLLTGSVDFFHAVHLPQHGMVGAGVLHLHELVLAFLDAGGIVVNLNGKTLLLFLEVGQLVQNPVALGFAGLKFLAQFRQFAGGAFHFLAHGENFVVDLLQFHQLADLFKVGGGVH